MWYLPKLFLLYKNSHRGLSLYTSGPRIYIYIYVFIIYIYIYIYVDINICLYIYIKKNKTIKQEGSSKPLMSWWWVIAPLRVVFFGWGLPFPQTHAAFHERSGNTTYKTGLIIRNGKAKTNKYTDMTADGKQKRVCKYLQVAARMLCVWESCESSKSYIHNNS